MLGLGWICCFRQTTWTVRNSYGQPSRPGLRISYFWPFGTLQTGSPVEPFAMQRMRRWVETLTGYVVVSMSPIPESGACICKIWHDTAIQRVVGRIKWRIEGKSWSQDSTQNWCSRTMTRPTSSLLIPVGTGKKSTQFQGLEHRTAELTARRMCC